jgi:hypothetical protein
MDHRRADRGVGVEVELLDALVAGEPGVVDPMGSPPLVPVIVLGHYYFGEEAEVGQLLSLGCGGTDRRPSTPPFSWLPSWPG